MQKPDDNIIIKGARVNNLKGIDVEIPRGELVVITGLSGSGKSSLAFDTLYAEGQRRYVESLSAYARQFMGKMAKPECDFIKGLPPAIAIEQKVSTRNPRSTVGTSTEIYDYLRLLFARIGRTISPVSGEEVKKHSVNDIIEAASALSPGTRLAIAAPIHIPEGRKAATQLDVYLKGGYSRLIDADGNFITIADILAGDKVDDSVADRYMLLIDRMAASADPDEVSRMADSAETALFEGNGCLTLYVWDGGDKPRREEFSTRFEADGMTFMEPSDQMFNFNNPYGACPCCEGFGKTMGIDERLVVPDPGKSVYEDAVVCWRGEKMSEWKQMCIRAASAADFPIHRPYAELLQAQKDFLWHGGHGFEGIDGFFRMVEENLYKIQYRVMLARYRGKTVCPDCHGSRLRPDALYVHVAGQTIADLVTMPVERLRDFFVNMELTDRERMISRRLLPEIISRLTFLCDVGLGYLTLDRLSSTLSGGESQRINLATSLGSSLVGSLYILDEPSIGLHQRDNEKLLATLTHLRDLGNTLIVVEHDEETIRAADFVVDVGPGAGVHGGEIVAAGTIPEIIAEPRSVTGKFLSGERRIPVPDTRRKPENGFITLRGCEQNNLKNVTASFPIGLITAVTGVSGSGKSSLVNQILYPAAANSVMGGRLAVGKHASVEGLERIDKVICIDQSPIGRTPRSNPATYTGVFGAIRELFAKTPDAQERGYKAGRFSFNVKGGRCESCGGDGIIRVEMNFLPDVYVPCEVCDGKRYNRETLTVKYKGKSIADVLEMTIEEAYGFFENIPQIANKIRTLYEVGLGYIKMGQPATTLSGGEAQRVKLATELSRRSTSKTLYILDEPTTGLHIADVEKLISILQRLAAGGNTVAVIEHNLDVIKTADYIIDLGPEGGDKGGTVIAAGTPEEVAKIAGSETGRFLLPIIERGY